MDVVPTSQSEYEGKTIIIRKALRRGVEARRLSSGTSPERNSEDASSRGPVRKREKDGSY